MPDGDGFRMVHTPFLRSSQLAPKAKLSETTVYVRLAGIDAPEMAHFGGAGQPFAEEARDYLKSLIDDKMVTVELLQRDQYRRAVSMVWVRKPWSLFRTNVSLEMVRKGLAVVYTSAGAQYGDILPKLKDAEEKAKNDKVGMWKQGRKFVSPKDYKAMGLNVPQPEAAASAAAKKPVSWWRRFITW
eukprot:TRINITY_DN1091_c0_g1_i1.p1 TRINITY_DN1091_c0_g1~~TRINITY_DN1091_c0_g1_i1.p1  ORF type:complete len:186 (+),score=35.59 TRINITY_DN1091_c0_g1_i1:145-702(+)